MKRGTPDHPKAKRLAKALGISLVQVVGHLELLWHFTAKYAPRGDIGRFTDEDIEDAIGWSGQSGALVTALTICGWLDSHSDPVVRIYVHDWHEHADEAVKKALTRAGAAFVCGEVRSRPTTADNGRPPEPEPEPSQSLAKPEPEPPPANDAPFPSVEDYGTAVVAIWGERLGQEPRGSTLDMELIRKWYQARIPLRVVRRGIQDCNGIKPGETKSLRYFGPAVADAVKNWRRSGVL